ncbi:MAG: PAS domain-containing protein [Candidatus Methanomethylophilaceae archaeon]|nr:PAS domain-containing protein [Candidatus Methanomethylophilaceae archaeon]
MDLLPLFKSVIDQDRAPVVICDLCHDIVYMNPAAAEHYGDDGGELLVGHSVMDCHSPKAREMISKVVEWFKEDESHNIIHTFYSESKQKDVYMVALRDGGNLIGYYEKHESRKRDMGGFYAGIGRPGDTSKPSE